jgi:bacterial/archaeal transporter family-2 protein
MAFNSLLPLILLALLAGSMLPVQAGVNFQLARVLGHPLGATFISFSVGALTLFLILTANGIRPHYSALLSAPWWMWTGGLLGAVVVGGSVVLAPRLGATTMIALFMTGQVIASIVIDHFGLIGFPVHPLTWLRGLGAACLVVGMLLIQRN